MKKENCKEYCNCAKEAMQDGANRDVVDGYENECPFNEKNIKKEPIIIESDDCDISPATCEILLGGNGDYYVVVKEDRNGTITSNSCRISTSGGKTPLSVRVAIANLYRTLNHIDNVDSTAKDLQELLNSQKEINKLKKINSTLSEIAQGNGVTLIELTSELSKLKSRIKELEEGIKVGLEAMSELENFQDGWEEDVLKLESLIKK